MFKSQGKRTLEADTLAKEALANEAMDEFDEIQYMSSIDFSKVQQIENEGNWMTPIVTYLKDGRLLKEKDKVRKVRVR